MSELEQINKELYLLHKHVHTMPLVVLTRKLLYIQQKYDGQIHVLYRCEASMSFSPREIVDVTWSDSDGLIDIIVTVGYFGLQSTDSPLPLNTHEVVIRDAHADRYALHDFYNFFNHRFIELLALGHIKFDILHPRSGTHKIWSSLAGLSVSDEALTDAQRLKLMSMSALMFGKNISANNIAQIIQKYFDFTKVELEHYVERNVYLDKRNRSFIGLQNSNLGTSMMLGKIFKDRQNTCRFHIHLDDPQLFLPNGRQYGILKKIIEFLLPKYMLYHIALHLPDNIPMIVGSPNLYLGWTTLATRQSQPQTIHLKG